MEKLKFFIKKYVIFINTAAYIFIYGYKGQNSKRKNTFLLLTKFSEFEMKTIQVSVLYSHLLQHNENIELAENGKQEEERRDTYGNGRNS